MKSIREILIARDDMSPEEADELIELARDDFYHRLDLNDSLDSFCEDWFGLEPDYLEEFF